MPPNLIPGQPFPDFELPDHAGQAARLSALMARRPDWEHAANYDYHAIHSDAMYGLTHGMMDKFISLAHERVQPQ
jgi:hypothetical protein